MSDGAPKIVVAGDVSVDWLQVSVPSADLLTTDGKTALKLAASSWLQDDSNPWRDTVALAAGRAGGQDRGDNS